MSNAILNTQIFDKFKSIKPIKKQLTKRSIHNRLIPVDLKLFLHQVPLFPNNEW